MSQHATLDLTEISGVLEGRPVRWASAAVGDYDGRERTLEVFLADAAEQRPLLRLLRPLRPALEAGVGGPVVVVFHTWAETFRLYPEVLPGLALGMEPAPALVDVQVWAKTPRPPRRVPRAA
ncbi:MAG: hypothetical protein HY906_23915 [Deltaproteobacteria bacterium]|nr:hypothetical protein [Deltaproteobacteria bacterium]